MIDSSKYVKTHLLQIPYYLKSATHGSSNLLLNKKLMKAGLDSSSNSGYDFYKVFVRNYHNIWHELVANNSISKFCYDYLKKDIYENFIVEFNYTLLVRHKNVKSEDASYIGNRKGFKIGGRKKY